MVIKQIQRRGHRTMACVFGTVMIEREREREKERKMVIKEKYREKYKVKKFWG